jgi:hypothetical protein
VQATHYGTLALGIIAVALGVFVLTAVARAIRRGRRGREAASRPGQDPEAPPDRREDSEGADNVMADG